jgi:hypothetical protein
MLDAVDNENVASFRPKKPADGRTSSTVGEETEMTSRSPNRTNFRFQEKRLLLPEDFDLVIF